MMVKRKDILITKKDKKAYEVVGKTGKDIVLAPLDEKDDKCLICTEKEISKIFELKKSEAKAIFGRKISNLQELKDLTSQALREGNKGNTYTITKEVTLEDQAFKTLHQTFYLTSLGLIKKILALGLRIKKQAKQFWLTLKAMNIQDMFH